VDGDGDQYHRLKDRGDAGDGENPGRHPQGIKGARAARIKRCRFDAHLAADFRLDVYDIHFSVLAAPKPCSSRLLTVPAVGLEGFVQGDVGDLVGVVADQLEGDGENDFQHLGLGESGGEEGLHFLFGPAPLFNHRPGEIAERRQPPVVDRLAVADGIDGLLRRARLGRHHAVGRHVVGAAVVDADGKGKEVLFGGRQVLVAKAP
jgi:hypothetical protein